MPNTDSSIILYTAPDGAVKVEVTYDQDDLLAIAEVDRRFVRC